MTDFLKQFLDLIYPPRCPICRCFLNGERKSTAFGQLIICPDCLDAFVKIRSPRCNLCGRPFNSLIPEDHLCENCLRNSPLYDALGAPYLFQGNIISAIHQFKYGEYTGLGTSFGILLSLFAEEWLKVGDDFLVMPVPLHPKRLRERGYNQSLLMARPVASGLGIDLDYLSLRRSRHTLPQTDLRSHERRKNVRGAFYVEAEGKLKGRTALVIDDVTTTGSTLNECARVLKKAGAERVYCIVLARTAGH